MENPFTPSFGEIPAHLAGRRPLLKTAELAYEAQRRRPELTTLISGARGSGKTTLLSAFGKIAEGLGWIALDVTCGPDMLVDIEVQARKKASHLVPEQGHARLVSIGIPQAVEFSFEKEAAIGNWRSRMEELLDSLDQTDTGILITVDEVKATEKSMVELAAIYQHFVRDGRKVSLLMAGLPSNISSLLNDKTVSFLRRAQIVKLGRIDDQDIASAMRKTIEESGRSIDRSALEEAVAAIQGFPFLMQLVGFRAWDEYQDEKEITLADVQQGKELAYADFRTRVLDATYRELSDGDIEFLGAMLKDDGDSAIADIVGRLGKSPSSVSQYRRRMIEAGIIGERRRGVVGFDMPFFKSYLSELLV